MLVFVVFFFFKQKTAYEMRISDWSSDVCSSDLRLCGYVWPQVGYQPLLPPPVFAEQPSMTVAFVFPGQGSQAVGMGRALAEAFPVARHTLEEVDDALGQKLSRLMFEGPEEERSEEQQSELQSLMSISYAVFCLKKKKIQTTNN